MLNGLRTFFGRLFSYFVAANFEIFVGIALFLIVTLGSIWVVGFVFRSGWDAADIKKSPQDEDEVPF